jgi:hypothetical protein
MKGTTASAIATWRKAETDAAQTRDPHGLAQRTSAILLRMFSRRFQRPVIITRHAAHSMIARKVTAKE